MGEIVDAHTIRNASKYSITKSRTAFDLSRKRSSAASKKSTRSVKTWWNAPETKRKKRVAKYKFYAVEGKVKSSFKKGFRWIKSTCSRIVHGV